MKQKASYTVNLEFATDTALDEDEIEAVAFNILDALWSWVDASERGLAPDGAFTSDITIEFNIHKAVKRLSDGR
jgi:uncharacterized membrane protein